MKGNGFTIVGMMALLSLVGLFMTLSTFPIAGWINERRSCRAADTVVHVLDRAGAMARAEGNEFVVFFDVGGKTMWILDDDGGADREAGSTHAGNGMQDPGERVLGPYNLPAGQIFAGFEATGVSGAPVTFSGDPPKVVFYPDGTASEDGTIRVMSESEYRSRRAGAGRMMVLRGSTGSVSVLEND